MDTAATKICPYCNAEIDANAQKCKFCGEWVNKESEELPAGLKHFNWGAFLMNWIWGIMHRKYITLLYFPACLIPVIGPIAISIWFGIMGNKWAWGSKNWSDIEEFNRKQQDYVRIWIILAILGIIITIKVVAILIFLSNVNV